MLPERAPHIQLLNLCVAYLFTFSYVLRIDSKLFRLRFGYLTHLLLLKSVLRPRSISRRRHILKLIMRPRPLWACVFLLLKVDQGTIWSRNDRRYLEIEDPGAARPRMPFLDSF